MPTANLLPVRGVSDPALSAPVPTSLTADAAVNLARSLKAIADPARLRLISIIAAQTGAEVCNCDLIEPLGLGQPTVSHHLKVLVDAGILARKKRGTWADYRVVPGALDALAKRIVLR
ncbi:transcriptional regulator [Cryobacterium cheniae]|uniref:Transcriptional regulator n=1 Tax=Cryobacterium cheniae TaxID=1259262 RepID=A0A4R8XHE7_9MICO|nr:metalloregulator ArsR/SmtB family transcription factor [Cryobacterium cheniae]TFC76612.1 transcriptional regulator [Cryobacterium cheniae]